MKWIVVKLNCSPFCKGGWGDLIFMPSKKFQTNLHYSASLKEKARQLRSNLTPAERHFWNSLRRMPFYKRVSFNRQKPIGNYIVDFYCHRLKLVIEIDGDTHGEPSHISYDLNRTQNFESKGLRVLRFSNREVLENIDGVMGKIEELVDGQDGKSP